MVHTAKEFIANQPAPANRLQSLKAKFTWKNGDTVDTVQANINSILETMAIGAPKYVITPSYYAVGDDGTVFDSASFVLRPSAKAPCTAPSLKINFSVSAGSTVYADFIDYFAGWIDKCMDMSMMYDNLADLQTVFDEVVAEENIPFTVKFDLGTGILDLSDTSITVGISTETAMKISRLPLYSTIVETAREDYKAALGDILKACAKPMDFIMQKTPVNKDLGITTRKTMVKLIRKCVTRRVAFTRVGEGWAEGELNGRKWFAVVSKVLCTEDEAAQIAKETPNAYIINNDNSTKSEKEAGKTKIYVAYKVSPFDENHETVDVDIKSIEGIVEANK